MWIPRWIGEPYARLYGEFQLRVFRFEDALKVLSASNAGMAKAVFSRLHKESLLAVFKRSRPRLYRLMDPETFIALASGKIKKVVIPQETYLNLIYGCCKALMGCIALTSLAVYGSVARGTAGNTSDLDLLVVSDDFKGTLGKRIESLMETVKERVEPEVEFLRENGIHTFLSLYPLKSREVERLPLIMLDMVDDAKIVYDKDGFLERQLLKLKLKLLELGAKRVYVGRDRWYWDLCPNYKPLEAALI
ncbi:MAG: nucleotidyltransferase domain-containing protein [Candidatus Bathyarchaeia archaeon]